MVAGGQVLDSLIALGTEGARVGSFSRCQSQFS